MAVDPKHCATQVPTAGPPASGPGPTIAAFVEIVVPRPGTPIPPRTAILRVEVFSTQPSLPHYVQFFFDVPHVPNAAAGMPPADVVPNTTQAQVQFNEPAYPNIGTAFIVPPALPVGAGTPNYMLTCWVGNDINLRYTGQQPLHTMPERVVQVVGSGSGTGSGSGSGTGSGSGPGSGSGTNTNTSGSGTSH